MNRFVERKTFRKTSLILFFITSFISARWGCRFFRIQNPVDSPFVQIMRASHVIKGAASNLMCAQLRLCAMNLENAASAASNDPAATSNPAVLQNVQTRYQELQVAVQNYKTYLQSVGV